MSVVAVLRFGSLHRVERARVFERAETRRRACEFAAVYPLAAAEAEQRLSIRGEALRSFAASSPRAGVFDAALACGIDAGGARPVRDLAVVDEADLANWPRRCSACFPDS